MVDSINCPGQIFLLFLLDRAVHVHVHVYVCDVHVHMFVFPASMCIFPRNCSYVNSLVIIIFIMYINLCTFAHRHIILCAETICLSPNTVTLHNETQWISIMELRELDSPAHYTISAICMTIGHSSHIHVDHSHIYIYTQHIHKFNTS